MLRPSDAHMVSFLKRAALFLSAMADAAPEYSPTREEGLSLKDGCYGFADALEAASAEPFEAKVKRGAIALAKHYRDDEAEMAAPDSIRSDDARIVLEAAGVE